MKLETRVLLFFTKGAEPKETWLRAAAEEAPVSGPPKACAACPLRRGGEWEAGAKAALAEMDDAARAAMGKRWGCHEGSRPCAGMRRLVRKEESDGADEVGAASRSRG